MKIVWWRASRPPQAELGWDDARVGPARLRSLLKNSSFVSGHRFSTAVASGETGVPPVHPVVAEQSTVDDPYSINIHYTE